MIGAGAWMGLPEEELKIEFLPKEEEEDLFIFEKEQRQELPLENEKIRNRVVESFISIKQLRAKEVIKGEREILYCDFDGWFKCVSRSKAISIYVQNR